MNKVSITITGNENEVDKILRENSRRDKIGLIKISSKKVIKEPTKSIFEGSNKLELEESKKSNIEEKRNEDKKSIE